MNAVHVNAPTALARTPTGDSIAIATLPETDAAYFRIDVNLVRLGFGLFTVFYGLGIIGVIVVMPGGLASMAGLLRSRRGAVR